MRLHTASQSSHLKTHQFLELWYMHRRSYRSSHSLSLSLTVNYYYYYILATQAYTLAVTKINKSRPRIRAALD